MEREPEGVITDTTILSHFARSGHFELLRALFPNGIWTTAEVLVRELQPFADRYPDLQPVLAAEGEWLHVIEELTLEEEQTRQRLVRTYAQVRRGADAGILAVACERGWTVLTDDNRKGKGMRYVADQEGIPCRWSLDLLNAAVQRELISAAEADQIKQDMATRARYERLLREG